LKFPSFQTAFLETFPKEWIPMKFRWSKQGLRIEIVKL
jgi:hypothetical protein